MKPRTGLAAALLGLALLPAELPAAEGGEAAQAPRTRMHQQLNQLLRVDAGKATPAAPVEAAPPAAADEIIQLEPMIIEEEKLKDLPPPETRTEKFFRTGTLWEKVGHRFTKRFWVDSGRGIGFTLSW